jgi:hypothetical protein
LPPLKKAIRLLLMWPEITPGQFTDPLGRAPV